MLEVEETQKDLMYEPIKERSSGVLEVLYHNVS